MEHRVPFCTVCLEAKKEAEEIRQAAFKKRAKRRGRKEWEEGSDEEEEAMPVGVMKVCFFPVVLFMRALNDASAQPDITFFGEKLADDFEHALEDDRDKVDLLIVIGTSLKVSPVSEILCKLKMHTILRRAADLRQPIFRILFPRSVSYYQRIDRFLS
jgi:NAD-dependent histone deacetylase SIR2